MPTQRKTHLKGKSIIEITELFPLKMYPFTSSYRNFKTEIFISLFLAKALFGSVAVVPSLVPGGRVYC